MRVGNWLRYDCTFCDEIQHDCELNIGEIFNMNNIKNIYQYKFQGSRVKKQYTIGLLKYISNNINSVKLLIKFLSKRKITINEYISSILKCLNLASK